MKILTTILTLACFGLVSCYPVASMPNPNTQNAVSKDLKDGKKAAKKTAKDTKKAAKKTTKKITNETNNAKKSVTDTAGDVKDSVEKEVKNTEKKIEKKVEPTGVKTAAKVPGKPGFVFSPYTHNQVDVRGIPSGSKVRDPNDANKAHVFRVP